ncbi:MAG TPA: hypothetical protein VHD35_05985 [Chitinophagaceae bacterium]|nr:hypothetical protein [Chitinophagaceae bacterium]
MTFEQTILAGAIGGLVVSIALPLISYFFLRLFNKFLVCIEIDERDETNYKVHNIKVYNHSLTTLKNIIVHVSIDNHKNDIVKDSRISMFCSDAKVDRGMLSWSKNIDDKNLPQIDINQGEIQDINLIRYHISNPDNAIEVASEQGFFEESNAPEKPKRKCRVLLNGNRSYKLKLIITGENIWPKRKTYKFDHEQKKLTRK